MGIRNGLARKGQFYSIIAIVIAIPILLFISGALLSAQKMKFPVAEKLVADQLHMVEKSIEDDFHKGVEISVKRSILTLTNDVIKNGTFISPIGPPFVELYMYGTINGQQRYLMLNNTLNMWKQKILNVTTGFEADFNFTAPSAQVNGMVFEGAYGIDIRVADRFGISRIEKKNEQKNYSFSVEGFEDPLFPLSSNGLVRRQYHPYLYSNYTIKFAGTVATANTTGNMTFNTADPLRAQKILVIDDITGQNGWRCVIGETGAPDQPCYVLGVTDAVNSLNKTNISLGGWETLYVDNMTNAVWSLPLADGVNRGLYYMEDGPNILERLEGRFNTTTPQFLTFVNIQELQNAGVPVVSDRTLVDWVYFGGFDVKGRWVRGFPSWFKVDPSTANVFNLTDLLQ